MGRIQKSKSTILCVCVFAPHVAFDHEIHVATSHAWVSSRFRGVLVCMTPGYVVSHTLLRLVCGRVAYVLHAVEAVRVRLLTPTGSLQIPPPQFRGSCQCVGGLVSFKSLSRGRVGGGSSLSHVVWLSVADSRVVIMVVI